MQSHRSPHSIFQADFDKLQGCIYHLGNPYLRDPDVKTCFFASDLLTDYWKEEIVSFNLDYVPSVQRLLQELLAASPEGKLLFTSDYQFGANPHWYKRIVRLETFWKRHDAKRLPINPLSGTLNLEGIRPNALPQSITFLFHLADNSGDLARTADVPPVGDFILPDVPANTYSVRIKSAKYLAKNVTLTTTTGAVRNLTATLKTGDANDDNAIDIADLLLMIAHYNKTRSTGDYLNAADFDGDGANDVTDLLLLIGNYNQMGD